MLFIGALPCPALPQCTQQARTIFTDPVHHPLHPRLSQYMVPHQPRVASCPPLPQPRGNPSSSFWEYGPLWPLFSTEPHTPGNGASELAPSPWPKSWGMRCCGVTAPLHPAGEAAPNVRSTLGVSRKRAEPVQELEEQRVSRALCGAWGLRATMQGQSVPVCKAADAGQEEATEEGSLDPPALLPRPPRQSHPADQPMKQQHCHQHRPVPNRRGPALTEAPSTPA